MSNIDMQEMVVKVVPGDVLDQPVTLRYAKYQGDKTLATFSKRFDTGNAAREFLMRRFTKCNAKRTYVSNSCSLCFCFADQTVDVFDRKVGPILEWSDLKDGEHVECYKCRGAGRYRHYGPCYRCAGKGYITRQDDNRNRVYDNYNYGGAY